MSVNPLIRGGVVSQFDQSQIPADGPLPLHAAPSVFLQCHGREINLQGLQDRSVIVWMTARRGDAALLTHEGNTERQFVDSVELYRVFPADYNGTVFESTRAWLDQVNPDDFHGGEVNN